MKHVAVWLACGALAISPRARASDFGFEARAPLRAGFAYTGITRGPAFSLALAIEYELHRITPRLSFYAVFDIDTKSRLDLPSEQNTSTFSELGLGGGLFYLSDVGIAFGLDGVAATTLDAKDLVGGGFAAHGYIYPFYERLADAVQHKNGLLVSYLQSGIAFWIEGRVDWTDVGRGGTLSFGLSLDLTRALFLPYAELLTKVFH